MSLKEARMVHLHIIRIFHINSSLHLEQVLSFFALQKV